jgi:oligoribonuclease NrnB/cAMP/cGMP phosphodiesterase (DHH superfamily)
MLQIMIPDREFWDERKEEFIQVKSRTLQLEHSLVSLSKWEAKWHKPFLSKKPKTWEESIDYVRCMTLTQNVDPNVYRAITSTLLQEINAYIDASMTATTISNNGKQKNQHQIVTAEIIYYWMICNNIPFECQKWHLDRLLTLINVCRAKNSKPEKIPRSEALAQRRALNAARKKQYHTRG